MPHNFDFKQFENIKTIEVTPEGWISPLYVEYTIGAKEEEFSGNPSYYWRVKGTQHTFIIPVSRLDYVSSGDYKTHFEDALETFREDYLSWKEQGFPANWAREYREQFYRFIIT